MVYLLRSGIQAALILGLVAGCDLFAVREAEDPSGGAAVFRQPDRPEVVLENLESAVEGMSAFNFTRSLDEEAYGFTPAPAAQSEYPDVWLGWDVMSEGVWFRNMAAASVNGSGHSLQITEVVIENASLTEQQVVARYALTVFHNRASAGVPTLVRGRMALRIVQAPNGLWSIREWTDIPVGSDPTWSDLRARFYRD